MIIKTHFLINDKECVCYVEKNIYDRNIEYDLDIFRLKTKINDIGYENSESFDCMELAIRDLQKQLPYNFQICCCLSCRYGNFCPYGNAENEIFCFIDYKPESKDDVLNIFDVFSNDTEPNELLYCCDKYQKASIDYFNYNDWIYHFR